jgi:hypothetical protein
VGLLQGDRRPSTVKSYDQKWLKFEASPAQVQDNAGAQSGTISAKSLQPYLSVINAVHNDFEYPPPAYGHLVKLARKASYGVSS